MSGSVILSPSVIDTTLLEDGQNGTITAAYMRQLNDSTTGLFTTAVTGSYTFGLNDRGTQVESTSATPVVFAVPSSGFANFAVNTVVSWRQYGAGQITFTTGSVAVALRTASSLTSRAQYSAGTVQLRAINEWVIEGDLT